MRVILWTVAGLASALALGCSSGASNGPLTPAQQQQQQQLLQQQQAQMQPGYVPASYLIPQLTLQNSHLRHTAAAIARTGNPQEKDVAGARLIQLSEMVASDAWRESQRPLLQRMNANVLTQGDLRSRLNSWQRRHQMHVYGAMVALGGERVLAYCRHVAKDIKRENGEQKMALSVLAAHGKTKRKNADVWGMPASRGPSSQAGPPRATTFRNGAQTDAAPTKWPTEFGGAETPKVPQHEAPVVEGGRIINVNEVVDALRPYFEQCYRQALRQHGRFGAWIIVAADVGSDGGVRQVGGRVDESIPYSFVTCLRQVVRQARFAPPEGGNARVTIPLTFTVPAIAEPPAAGNPPAAPPRAPVAPPAGPPAAAPGNPVTPPPASPPPAAAPIAPSTR